MNIRSEAVWITAAVLVCLAASEVRHVFAQNNPDRNGWIIRQSRSADRVQFGIDRSRDNNRWISNNDVPWSAFRNLTPDQLARLEGKHTFEFVRDPGKFVCTGVFSGGRGLGSYTFEPNANFVSELTKLGYMAPTQEDLFSMTMHDISLEFARTVRTAGLNASIRELMDLRVHGVSTEYIRETQALGFTKLSARDYVEMKIHGVQTDFMRDLKGAGYDVPVREIVEMKIHGVDSRYMRELARYGLQPPARDIVEMKIHGVSPEFLKGVTDSGYTNLSAREVVDMKIHGVNPDFLKDSKSLGFNFTLREIVEMRNHGVNSSYLRKVKDSGFANLTADKIIRLKVHGID